MAAVKTLAGEKLLIQIEDPAVPGVFVHDCLINSDRGISMSADVTDIMTPDCDDPTLPAWKEIFKDGLQISISGSGVLHTTSVETWFNWMNVDTIKNVRIKLDVSQALGGGYISGAFKLTSFNITGTRKNNSTAEVTLLSHGACTWTDN